MDTKTILFPTNFSETSLKALDLAVSYAKKTHHTITLLNIIEDQESIPETLKINFENDDAGAEEIIATTKLLLENKAKKISSENSITVTYRILFGNFVHTLMKAIILTNAEIIIMGTNGSSRLNGLHLHTNTYKISDRAPIPVITVNSKAKFTDVKKILFPISDKLYTTKKLYEIKRLAKLYNCQVVLLGISPTGDDELEEVGFYMEDLQIKLQNENINTKISMAINKNYAQEILGFANKNEIDLICVISKYDHGFVSLFKTTPDETLVEESIIPVLSIPLETENLPGDYAEVEYISPWSKQFDVNRIFLPNIFKK